MTGRPLQAVITGVGHHVPPRVLTNLDLEKMVDTSDAWIRERTGISERHIVDAGSATSDLAYEAARAALLDAGVSAAELDLVIVATATPDMPFPATACLVQHRLGAARAGAFDLECGCSGFVYALAVGSQFIQSGTFRRVLVIGADTLTRVTDFTDRNTCVLFGDGAGAVVLEPSTDGHGVLSMTLRADGGGAELLRMPAGGSRLPASTETLAAGQHYIQMAGNEVFKFAVKVLGEAALELLDAAGLTVEDVKLFVPHQANLRIMSAAARRAGIPEEKLFCNVERYGNTSCASIPIALSEAVSQGRLGRDDVVTICGFGAGLAWGGAVMRWGYSRVSTDPAARLSAAAHESQGAVTATVH